MRVRLFAPLSGACVVAVVATMLICGARASLAASISSRAPIHWGATGVPIPPPPNWATPALLARFFSLYIAYVHLPPQGRPTFGEFLLAKGVVDPALFAKMVALYHWYTHVARSADTRGVGGVGAR